MCLILPLSEDGKVSRKSVTVCQAEPSDMWWSTSYDIPTAPTCLRWVWICSPRRNTWDMTILKRRSRPIRTLGKNRRSTAKALSPTGQRRDCKPQNQSAVLHIFYITSPSFSSDLSFPECSKTPEIRHSLQISFSISSVWDQDAAGSSPVTSTNSAAKAAKIRDNGE